MCPRFVLYMQFNDTSTNKNGLIQECETWLFGSQYGAISDNADILATFTRLLNHGMNETATLIMLVDGRWQYHDTNHPDYPIATTNLVAGQQDYQLATDFLNIEAIEIRKSDGDYFPLRPLDIQDIRRKGLSITEFMDEEGLPVYYDVQGQSIFLYPKPRASDVTTTAGLKIYTQRNPSYFTTADTTKQPGIPTLFHDIPVLFGCSKYAKSNTMSDKARELDAEILRRTNELKTFYSKRNVDDKPVIRARYKSAQ